MDLEKTRTEYTRSKLNIEDLNADPFMQFEHWFKEATETQMDFPNAFSLATASAEGRPSLRTVLLKFFDHSGLVFFTNYESRKAGEIKANPQVALLFPWTVLERQVIITGRASKITTSESLKYFATRPRGSQIGAWVSGQSSIINSRQMLLMKFDEMKRKFKNREIPLPSFWGGYRVVPDSFEFWQGRENRLHDRFYYTPVGEDGAWKIERLAP